MSAGGVRCAAAVAVLATVVLATAASAFPATFQLDREAVLAGEPWRLWTGHLVHASRDHLVFDVGAACLLFVALGNPLRSALRLALLAPLISAALLLALPDLDYYYGLSGLLHAWAVFGAGEAWKRERGARSHLAAAFGLGTVGKAAWETWTTSPTCSSGLDMGGPVIFAAHLIGALAGLALLASEGRSRHSNVIT